VNRRTRLEVNLNDPRAQFESLATRLELYQTLTDGTFEAMEANYMPRIEALKSEVEALYNNLTGLEEDFITLSKEPGPSGVSPTGPGFLLHTPLTSALEWGYQYVSNNTPDAGYEVFGRSGDTSGVVFTNALFPLTITLNVTKSVVTKYEIGAGFPSQAPED